MNNLKQISLILALALSSIGVSQAQNTFPASGAAGIGTTSPNASSLLEVKSTTKGVLFPRMTFAQRNAIASPAAGLLIYQTNNTPGFYFYTGTAWSSMSTGNSWLLTGNSGTDSLDFIGTTDAQPLVIKVRSAISGHIDYQASLGNTSLGFQALRSSTGSLNTIMGYQAGFSNTTGIDNTALGNTALYSNTTGGYNVAIGLGSLSANTGGFTNTAIGMRSMNSNQTGSSNAATGYYSLYSNTTGGNNTANGPFALYSNTTGFDNVASGSSTLFSNTTGIYNTAYGTVALYKNVTGDYNTASGVYALYNNTASGNTATGYQALYSNTTSTGNTAMGMNAVEDNTTGSYNSGFGTAALNLNTTGNENVAQGAFSMFENSTGGANVAIGYESQYFNQFGSGNTGVGYLALIYNTSGNDNTALGAFAGASGASSFNNFTALGYDAIITADNQVRIGNSSVTSIGGYVNWSNISDGRVKKNIKQNVPGLAFINQLQPVTYNLDLTAADNIMQHSETKDANGKEMPASQVDAKARSAKEQILYTGFVAQDVEKAAKKIGFDFSGVDAPKNDKDLYGLRYSDFVVPLVKAVQELSARNDSLQAEIDQLKSNSGTTTNGMVKMSLSTTDNTALLGQNIPNPFDHSTLIPFRVPGDCHDASIAIVQAATGRIIHLIPVSCTETQLSFDAGSLASGTYLYSLYVDGKLVETKQMVLTK